MNIYRLKSKDTRITVCLAYIGTGISHAIRRITRKYRTGLMREVYTVILKNVAQNGMTSVDMFYWYDKALADRITETAKQYMKVLCQEFTARWDCALNG